MEPLCDVRQQLRGVRIAGLGGAAHDPRHVQLLVLGDAGVAALG